MARSCVTMLQLRIVQHNLSHLFLFQHGRRIRPDVYSGRKETLMGFLSTSGLRSCCRRTQLSWRTLATGEAPLAQEVPIPVQEVGASLLHRLRSLQPSVHRRYQYRGRFQSAHKLFPKWGSQCLRVSQRGPM